jgi:hypothetical protein
MLLRRTCKEVCSMLIAREDKHLAVPDRLAIQLHLIACKMCPNFERQLLTMRNGLKHWKNCSADTD